MVAGAQDTPAPQVFAHNPNPAVARVVYRKPTLAMLLLIGTIEATRWKFGPMVVKACHACSSRYWCVVYRDIIALEDGQAVRFLWLDTRHLSNEIASVAAFVLKVLSSGVYCCFIDEPPSSAMLMSQLDP